MSEVGLSLVNASSGEENEGHLDDAALAELLPGGDKGALAALYDRHGTACFRLAWKVTANHSLAEDAVQEAFLGLWRAPSGYQRGRGSIRNWLLALTHHKAVDLVRRESAQQRRQDAQALQQATAPLAGPDPAEVTLQNIRAAEVRSAMTELPEAQRQAVSLAYFGGYTQTEIARLTGVPLGTVKTRTLAAMRRLRQQLAPMVALPEEGPR
jgi:RNA polymerase sigma-70 factor (ECF subfamily)